jgi:hypothetical protein
VGRISPAMRGRRSYSERLTLALSLLRDPALDCLISGESMLEELPDQLPRLFAPDSGVLCHRVRYSAKP